MRSPGSGPAAEEDVDADGQIDDGDEAESERQAAVHGDRNDRYRRFEFDAAPSNAVKCPPIAAGFVELPLQIADMGDGVVVDFSKQVVGFQASQISRPAGKNSLGE